MNEQIIILVFLIIALGITLWLYISKAKKQVKYRGDERWQLIQLKASNTANLAHSILIVLIAVLPLFINMQTTVTLQRVSIFALLYIGIICCKNLFRPNIKIIHPIFEANSKYLSTCNIFIHHVAHTKDKGKNR